MKANWSLSLYSELLLAYPCCRRDELTQFPKKNLQSSITLVGFRKDNLLLNKQKTKLNF